MKFHDTLNTKLWVKNEEKSTGGSTYYDIKSEVTAKLKEIAQAFIDYAEIPEDAIEDIVLTGSSASYNYTPFSDIDLHLIVDYDKLHKDCPIVENYLWSVKAQFNKEHDISIYDIPVELYAEDKNAGGVSNGIYSIKNDEWVKKPKRIPPTDNDAAVLAKYNEFAEAIEKVTEGEEAEQLLDKVYAMRKSGLEDGGEFSVENLTFKKLRDTGLLEMLKEMKKVEFDKELSLSSNTQWNFDILSKLFEQILKQRDTKSYYDNNAPKDGSEWSFRELPSTLEKELRTTSEKLATKYFKEIKGKYPESLTNYYIDEPNTMLTEYPIITMNLPSIYTNSYTFFNKFKDVLMKELGLQLVDNKSNGYFKDIFMYVGNDLVCLLERYSPQDSIFDGIIQFIDKELLEEAKPADDITTSKQTRLNKVLNKLKGIK